MIKRLSESEGIAFTIEELAREIGSSPVSVKGDLAALKADYAGSKTYELEVSPNKIGRTYCVRRR